MRSRVVRAVAVVVVLASAGCGGDDDEETAPAPSTTATTAAGASTSAPATTAPATTAGAPAAEEPDDPGDGDGSGRSELEDGRHFGFWSTFEIGDTIAYGEFDLASFLVGAEAEAAAAQRGDEVDNDYYIVNDNPRLRTLVARGDTRVQVLDGGEPELRPSNVADFAVDRAEDAGFWVTIEDGIVTEIEQQFVP